LLTLQLNALISKAELTKAAAMNYLDSSFYAEIYSDTSAEFLPSTYSNDYEQRELIYQT